MSLLASLEKNSEHPLAVAVVEKAISEKAQFLKVEDFENIEGKGLKGTINGTALPCWKFKADERIGY